MNTIIFATIIFLEILEYLVFFDVILSWLTLLGVRFRPKFLRSILDPLYGFVKQYIPTRFGAFDFTPIVLLLVILFIRGIIIMSFPWVQTTINQVIR